MGRLSRLMIPLVFVPLAAVAAVESTRLMRGACENVAPRAAASPHAILEHAEWAHIYRLQPKIEIPMERLGPGKDVNPSIYALLKGGTVFDVAPPADTALVVSLRFREPGADHSRVLRLQYDMETGRIGDGGEWGQTPPGFRDWMRRMESAHPEREYGIVRPEERKVITPIPPSPDSP